MKLTDTQRTVLGMVLVLGVLLPAVVLANVWWIRHTWN